MTVDRYCSRPCFDCPFRADLPAYATQADVAENLRMLLHPEGLAYCHHTVPGASRAGDRIPPGEDRRRVCGGFLAVCQAVGLDRVKRWFERVRPVLARRRPPVYASLIVLAERMACPDQSLEGRLRAWEQLRPRRRP